MSIPYRPEIDGLRALAVTAVIVYHAGFTLGATVLLPGGFIGVDVFFVISGYLITAILLKDMQAGQFRLLNFYERRARRILPALLLMMAATLPPALLLLDAQALRDYSHSAFAALGFVANIGFWLEDGYTAAPSALKPLLHTWSLAVEEQFYLLFPVALMLLLKCGRRFHLPVLLLVLSASLALSHYGSAAFPSAGFFLLPTRAWELLGGVVLAVLESRGARNGKLAWAAPMVALGLLLMCLPFLWFHDAMRHPSLLTVAPVAGTMLVIWYADRQSWLGRLLSAKPFVMVGLLSYSLYLWHFPVFAFARHANVFTDNSSKLLLTGLAIVLAIAAWRCVETPLRDRASWPPRQLALTLGAAVTGIAMGFTLLQTHSMRALRNFSVAGRYFDIDAEKERRYQAAYAACGSWELDKCGAARPGNVNILVVGDSMAVDVNNMLGTLYPDYHFAHSSLGGCPPYPAISELVDPGHPDLQRCVELNRLRFASTALTAIDGVIIDIQMNWFTPPHLRPYLQHLSDQGMRNVMLVGNYIQLDRDLTELVRENGAQALTYRELQAAQHVVSNAAFEEELRALAGSFGYEFVSIAEAACNADGDCRVFVDGRPFTWDSFHFAVEFAAFAGTQLRPLLERSWLNQPTAAQDD